MLRAKRSIPGVFAAVVLAGCAHVTGFAYPVPPATSPPAPTTSAPDLTGAKLVGVPGQTTSTIAISPGGATVNGTVIGPNGPVAGADVHVERLAGSLVAQEDVASLADGTWSLPGVLGGRYRIRAWRSPDLALISPVIFFLNGTDTRSLTLQLQQFNAGALTAAIAPNPPIVGQPATLAIGLTSQVVDANGVARPQPVANAFVQLSSGGSWTISQPNPAITGPDGTVSWTVECTLEGAQAMTAVVNNADTYAVNLPPCSLPPPPTTTLPPTTTTTPGPTTTIKSRTPR